MAKKVPQSKATVTGVVPLATPIELTNGKTGQPVLFDPKGAPNSRKPSKGG